MTGTKYPNDWLGNLLAISQIIDRDSRLAKRKRPVRERVARLGESKQATAALCYPGNEVIEQGEQRHE